MKMLKNEHCSFCPKILFLWCFFMFRIDYSIFTWIFGDFRWWQDLSRFDQIHSNRFKFWAILREKTFFSRFWCFFYNKKTSGCWNCTYPFKTGSFLVKQLFLDLLIKTPVSICLKPVQIPLRKMVKVTRQTDILQTDIAQHFAANVNSASRNDSCAHIFGSLS